MTAFLLELWRLTLVGLACSYAAIALGSALWARTLKAPTPRQAVSSLIQQVLGWSVAAWSVLALLLLAPSLAAGSESANLIMGIGNIVAVGGIPGAAAVWKFGLRAFRPSSPYW